MVEWHGLDEYIVQGNKRYQRLNAFLNSTFPSQQRTLFSQGFTATITIVSWFSNFSMVQRSWLQMRCFIVHIMESRISLRALILRMSSYNVECALPRYRHAQLTTWHKFAFHKTYCTRGHHCNSLQIIKRERSCGIESHQAWNNYCAFYRP